MFSLDINYKNVWSCNHTQLVWYCHHWNRKKSNLWSNSGHDFQLKWTIRMGKNKRPNHNNRKSNEYKINAICNMLNTIACGKSVSKVATTVAILMACRCCLMHFKRQKVVRHWNLISTITTTTKLVHRYGWNVVCCA